MMTDNNICCGEQSGSVSFTAEAGDMIGFAIDAGDNCCGAGWVTVSNFTGPGQVPCIFGCMDPLACNYDSEATFDDESCIMPPEGFCDCDGNVFDECGTCNGSGPDTGYNCDGDCVSGQIWLQMDVWGGNATTWTISDSEGNVAFSGDMEQTWWPGDEVCGLSGDECYTFEANDTFDGWIYMYYYENARKLNELWKNVFFFKN